MKEFQKKQKIERKIYSKTTVIILVVVVAWLAWSVWGAAGNKWQSHKSRSEAEERLADLKAEYGELTAEAEWLKTSQGMEEEIRERFDVARSGEKLVILVDAKPIATSSETEKHSFWENIWNKIKDWF